MSSSTDWKSSFKGYSAWFKGMPCQPIDRDNIEYTCLHPYSCNACKRGPFTNGTPVFDCAQCRIVKYCSKNCQRSDWKNSHKSWCNAWVALRNSNDDDFIQLQNPGDMNTWRDLSSKVTEKVNMLAVAGLNTQQFHLVAMQPRCHRCLKAGILPGVDLVTCPNCHSVALCSDCHMRDDTFHEDPDDCEIHQISYACTGMIVEQRTPLCMESNTDMPICFQPKNWDHYFAVKDEDFWHGPDFVNMAPVRAHLTDGLSLPLTALHVLGLPALLGGEGVAEIERLVIHYIGASTHHEKLGISKFIEILRLVPDLTYPRIVLIGPDIEDFPELPLNIAGPEDMIRDSCDAKVMGITGWYHDVVGSLNEEATLAFAIHPGIFEGHYVETWRPTVEVLALKNTPFVVTGKNEHEVLSDRKYLEEFGAKVVVEPSKNPFRGERPYPDYTRRSDFMYINSHFVVSQGSCDHK